MKNSIILDPAPDKIRQNWIPYLNGFRAVAILLVISCHFGISSELTGWVSIHPWYGYFLNGILGVQIFFVLSGYLITYLLIQEEERCGKISAGKFIARRLLRIMPLFLIYLLSIYGLYVSGVIKSSMNQNSFLAALFWFYDYQSCYLITSPWIEHLWSLSFELKFYFVWLIIIICLKRKWWRYIVITLMVVAPISRYFLSDFPLNDFNEYSKNHLQHRLQHMFHTGMDTILIGCSLALWQYHPRLTRFFQIFRSPIWLTIASGYIFIIAEDLRIRLNDSWILPLKMSLDVLVLGFIVGWIIHHPQRWPGRLLENRVLQHIGTLSYSIYIWQQPFIFVLPNNYPIFIYLGIPITYLVALISYHYIEMPINRFRGRFRTDPMRIDVAFGKFSPQPGQS